MSRTLTAVGILLVGFTFLCPANSQRTVKGQTPSQPKPPAHTAPAPYQRQGTWYEFMLKQFNPNDLDYGGWIEQQRSAFIDARARNPYFQYGLCTTIGLLLMTAVCTKRQRRPVAASSLRT